MADVLSAAGRLASRGEFHSALAVLAPSLRRRLPRLDSFYDFVADQDLLTDNPRHPALTAAEEARARRGLARLKARPLRDALTSYALLCARRYPEAASRAAAARVPILEACALWLQGDARRSRRWLARALDCAELAVALSPSRASWLLRAQIRFEFEDNEKGLADLARILRRDPGDLAVRVGRSEILADLYRYRPAARELRRAARGGPAPWWFYAQRGRLRGMCGLLKPSLRDFDEALRRRPKRGAVRAWRAEVLRKLGRLEDARRDLDLATAHAPRYAFAWECRGRLRLMLGEPAAALRDLERACRLDPTHTLAFAWRGEARLRLGRLAGAWADFERIYPLEPSNVWNADDAAEGRLPARAARLASYWRTLDAAAARGDAAAYLLRGRARATTGREREAIADLTRARPRLPPALRGAALAWRGRARMNLGETAVAARDLSAAVALDPGTRRWKAWLGTALLSLGKKKRALRELDRALTFPEPGFTEAFLARGRDRASEGRLLPARDDFRAACLFDPRSEAARRALASLTPGRER